MYSSIKIISGQSPPRQSRNFVFNNLIRAYSKYLTGGRGGKKSQTSRRERTLKTHLGRATIVWFGVWPHAYRCWRGERRVDRSEGRIWKSSHHAWRPTSPASALRLRRHGRRLRSDTCWGSCKQWIKHILNQKLSQQGSKEEMFMQVSSRAASHDK